MAFPKSRTVVAAYCYRLLPTVSFFYEGFTNFFVHQNHLEGLLKLFLCF